MRKTWLKSSHSPSQSDVYSCVLVCVMVMQLADSIHHPWRDKISQTFK
jgi:hypothetical protein